VAGACLVITPPAAEPLTLAEAKLHLRGPVAADDDLVTALIQAAREQVENYVHRALINQTRELTLDCFPPMIELPFPPVTSLTSLKYTDVNGAEQTIAGADLDIDIASSPARIRPAYGQSWPSPRPGFNAVRARYVCGYGAAGASVPAPLRHALRLLLAHFYENREAVVIGQVPGELPLSVAALLNPYIVS
jgi:uncharacterized phiE125 gp8 family phage protein